MRPPVGGEDRPIYLVVCIPTRFAAAALIRVTVPLPALEHRHRRFANKGQVREPPVLQERHGQINEALCKVLCHNLCVLVQAMHELGIEPAF